MVISGTLYSDEGQTEIQSAGKTIKVRIATSTPGVYSTTTIASTGYWMVDGGIEAPPIGVPISVWVDGDSVDAFTFTKASSTENDITGVDLYQNRIIVKHEATSATSTTIADLAVYDADDEPGDIRFTANGGALEVEAGQKLYIWPNKVFAPGGAMTLHGNASAEPDGDLAIADGATFTAGGNVTLAGSWLASSTSTFNPGAYLVTFNASTSKSINAQGAQFYDLTIDGTASTTGSDFGVTNTFTVNSEKMLTINSSRFASSSPSGTVTLNGAIDGAGTLGITNSNLGTAGTLSSRVRFDTTAGNITMPARTYGGVVEPYNSGGTDEQITMNSGTHTFSGAVQPMAEGAGDITLDGATNNPTVNIAGNIDFYGEEAGSEIIWTGTGIWTASSSIIDFTGGTFTASSTNTFILEDTTTLTSNSQSFASTTVSGALTLTDEMSVSGNAIISGTVSPSTYPVKLTGASSKSLIGGGTVGALYIDTTGDYDLSGADLSVASTTVSSGGILSVGSGRTYTSTSTLTLSGTLDGTGTTTVQHSMLNSGGTLDTNVRFDATDGNITMPARVYGANVDIFGGSNTITAVGNATSTGAFIVSSGTFTAPGSTASLYIEGNFTNGGTFSANSGNVFLDGASQQILSGNMTGSDAFYNLTVANNSGGGDATNTPSVIFSNVASTTGTFTLNTNNTTVRFPVGATSTFQNIDWQASSGNEIKIRSSDTGGDPHTQWYVYTPGTETVSYVDFMDTNACGDGSGSIDASGAGNIDSGNNDCVLFTAVNPTASSTANQVFTVGPGPTQASSFRIIDNSTLATITATNDIRIAIATSTLDMEWGTSCNTPSFGGSASAKVESTVTFEGLDNSVAVIDVSTGFVAGDDLTISGLCFANFGSAGYKATGGLYVMKDGPTDQTSDADDTKSITIKGRMTLSNHDAGQESNKFYTLDVSVSEAELFNFKLTSSGEDIVVNNLEVSLTGISGVVSSDIENVYLFIDFNSNGVFDSAEVSEGGVGGAGNVNITGETGTITFSEDFTSTTSRNYILRANVSSLQSNDSININLDTSGITATGVVTSESIDSSGSTESVNHIKIIRYFGGASIGGVPQSDPQEEGGESEGGEIIGEEPGFMLPTSNSSPPGWSNYWANPTNAYVSDGNYTTDNAGGAQDFQSFTFNIPSGDQIDGIEVKLEASASGGAGGVIGVELSWDEGNSTTTSGTTTPALSESDTVYVLGGLSYKWGKSDWIDTHFSNSNFRLRIIGYPSGNIMRVDAIQVKVHHSAVGGSSGGGGDELLYKWPLWDTSLLANLLQATTTQISNLLSLFKNYF